MPFGNGRIAVRLDYRLADLLSTRLNPCGEPRELRGAERLRRLISKHRQPQESRKDFPQIIRFRANLAA